jgi:hypothetical protein
MRFDPVHAACNPAILQEFRLIQAPRPVASLASPPHTLNMTAASESG